MLLLALAISGCAVRSTFPTHTSTGVVRLQELIDRQTKGLTTFAALLRVKLSREGKIDDFRVELFSEGSQQLSLYVRGFLGKSAFKAVIVDDSLQMYFPGEGKYYSGARSDIEIGELKDTGHIIDFLLSLFEGQVSYPDTIRWLAVIDADKRIVTIDLRDRQRQFELNARLTSDDETFPFLRLQSIKIDSQSGTLHASLTVQSIRFNREIPASKLELSVPPSARSLSRDEVVELLAGKAP